MTELVDMLLLDIGNVARHNKDRFEFSMSRAGKHAHSFIVQHGINDY